jgi:hypothetical protein
MGKMDVKYNLRSFTNNLHNICPDYHHIVALDSDNIDDATTAMNDLNSLINEGVNPRNNTITPEAAAEITQQTNEIIIIVILSS